MGAVEDRRARGGRWRVGDEVCTSGLCVYLCRRRGDVEAVEDASSKGRQWRVGDDVCIFV